MCANSGYQVIFGEFVEGVKESEAQWYSIKLLHNGIPSLIYLLEGPADNLQSLLVPFGLGKSGQDNQQVSKFETFRSTSVFGTTQPKVNDTKTKQWFLRLDTQYIGDLSYPGSKGCATRVKNI
jgi:hypothetical protein